MARAKGRARACLKKFIGVIRKILGGNGPAHEEGAPITQALWGEKPRTRKSGFPTTSPTRACEETYRPLGGVDSRAGAAPGFPLWQVGRDVLSGPVLAPCNRSHGPDFAFGSAKPMGGLCPQSGLDDVRQHNEGAPGWTPVGDLALPGTVHVESHSCRYLSVYRTESRRTAALVFVATADPTWGRSRGLAEAALNSGRPYASDSILNSSSRTARPSFAERSAANRTRWVSSAVAKSVFAMGRPSAQALANSWNCGW